MELPVSVVLYTAATTASKVIDTLPAGTVVATFSESGKWIEVCYAGIKGWIFLSEPVPEKVEYIDKPPIEESLIAFAPDESVAVAIEEGEKQNFVRLSQLKPWFAINDSAYAGFYEGLPGEEAGLIIVNIFPNAITLNVKISRVDIDKMEPYEEEFLINSEIRRKENVLHIEGEELPIEKAEFIRYEGRYGLLIQSKDGYAVLWKRRL